MDNATQGFTSVDEFVAFAFAGKATFTMTSRATGEHFTFSLQAWKKHPNVFFASVKAPHGELKMGMIHFHRMARGVQTTKAAEVAATAPSVKAFNWLFQVLAQGHMPRTAVVQHDGRCGVCARKLTHPRSISTGIGPECSAKLSLACTEVALAA